jgi:hypothetical protein
MASRTALGTIKRQIHIEEQRAAEVFQCGLPLGFVGSVNAAGACEQRCQYE